MSRFVISVSLTPEMHEFADKRKEGPSAYIARLIREDMRMDEEKIQKRIQKLEEELAEQKEILQVVKKQRELENQMAFKRVEQIQGATIKTKEEARLKCPICAHPELASINSMIKEVRAKGEPLKEIRDKFSLSHHQITNHEGHMEG